MPTADIVLTDGFPILSLALVTEPLRVANRELGKKRWRWRFLSTRGGRLSSSSGIAIDTIALDHQRAEVILLLSSYHPEGALEKPLLGWLREKARSSAMMGCVDTGALIFAKAGILEKIPATAHFETLRGYREQFSEQVFADQLFHLSERRCSSAGGVATFDMTLGLISLYDGAGLAGRVADVLNYQPAINSPERHKRLASNTIKSSSQSLANAVELMMQHLDQPIAIDELAKLIGTPRWTIDRLFKRHFDTTPGAYYRKLRLSEARNLLRNSSLQIAEIASICGFDNPESFSRAYKREYAVQARFDRHSEFQGN